MLVLITKSKNLLKLIISLSVGIILNVNLNSPASSRHSCSPFSWEVLLFPYNAHIFRRVLNTEFSSWE